MGGGGGGDHTMQFDMPKVAKVELHTTSATVAHNVKITKFDLNNDPNPW